VAAKDADDRKPKKSAHARHARNASWRGAGATGAR
jgi:hypothetical protein